MIETRKRNLNLKTYIGGYCVSTVDLMVEHFGGMWYETYIFPAENEEIANWLEVWGIRYATRDEAVRGHERTCDQLRAGELKDYEGAVLA